MPIVKHSSTPSAWWRRSISLLLILTSVSVWIPAAEARNDQSQRETPLIDFQIPAQTLASALTQFATQSKLFLVYQSEIAQDQRTPAVNGRYTPDQALGLLLRDTELRFRRTPDGTVTIKEGFPRPQLVAVMDDSLAETQTQNPTTDDAPVETLPEVLVPGFRLTSDSYSAPNASTSTKMNMPLIQTPISVQVVPRAAIDDQQAIQVEDAIKNVSGVFPGFTFGGFAEEFMIRGFNTGFANYRDGFRSQAARMSLANIERVEVVKGAATNLYGRIEPGGLINLITKRPQEQSYYSLNQQFGSYGQYQTLVDVTGALNESKSLLYRLNFEYLNKDSFRDFAFLERYFVAPSITWKISERTRFDLDFMYSNEESLVDYGSVAVGNRPAKIPRSRALGEPTDIATHKLYNTAATFTHAFNDLWQVRARFGHFHRRAIDDETFGTSLDEATGILTRGFFGGPLGPGNENTYQGTVDVTGRFHTAELEHNVLVGWEYTGRFGQFKSIFINDGNNPINIFNPQYNRANLQSVENNNFLYSTNEWNGVYFQDQITLFEKLHIMGGGRYDWATNNSGSSSDSLSAARAAANKVTDNRFSPRAGIAYQPWEWLSLYGNYVQSLGAANSGIDAAGNTLKSQIGEQFEGGFKTSLLGGLLNSTVAYYHLTKQNLAVQVPGQLFSVAIGEARSQGVEVDISGQVTDGLSVILTYAYTDTKILEGNNKGNRLWNVPKHAGSIWARYDVQNELLRGLSGGAGVFVQGNRHGDRANTYILPSQTRIDAMVRYQLPIAQSRLSLQLNGYNLADSTLYGGTLGNRFSINVGIPRTFVGSIRIDY